MFHFILINFFRKYSLIESKGCFHINFAFASNYLYRQMIAYFVLNILYFHCIYFLWPKVNLYFQWTQSYCKSKRITLKQTFENIFLDIFCVDQWSDGGPLKSTCYSRRIPSSPTESSWRCLTRRRLCIALTKYSLIFSHVSRVSHSYNVFPLFSIFSPSKRHRARFF